MVSLLARFIEVSIRKGSALHALINIPINKIGNKLTIRWGRQSIWEPPARRTATVVIVMEPQRAYNAADHWLGSDIEVTGMHGIYLIGSITGFTVVPMQNGRSAVIFQVQETIYLRGFTSKTITTNAQNMKLLRGSLEIQKGRFNITPVDPVADDVRFQRDGTVAEEVPVIDVWEAVVNTRYVAQAAWTPDQKQVSPTCYRLARASDTRIKVPASQIKIEPIEFAIDETPPSVIFTTGGGFGEKRDVAQQSIGMGYGSGVTRETNIPFAVRDGHQGRDTALALLKAQKSSPRIFTIYDTLSVKRPTDSLADLFYPYEDPHTVLQITGARSLEYPAATEYYPIGGELTFTYQQTSHKLYCVYATAVNDAASWAEYPPRTYANHTTERWIDL